MKRRRTFWPVRAAFLLPAAGALALLAQGCSKGPAHTPDVEVASARAIPIDPGDPLWREAPVHEAELILQDLVEPRLIHPGIDRVEVRALTDGIRLGFRLAWTDTSRNDLPGASRFSDACAIQLPSTGGPDLPAPQMGEAGKQVEITYWRASWQGWIDGREDTINSLYPGAAVDPYPFHAPALGAGTPEQAAFADRYAPARGLGNAMEGGIEKSVQDLVAAGPGSIVPAQSQRSEGRGKRAVSGWEVVLVRDLPVELRERGASEVAFAVWEGGKEEVGARKMRSVWIPIRIVKEKP